MALSAQFAHDAPVDGDSEDDVIMQLRLRAKARLNAARAFLLGLQPVRATRRSLSEISGL